jgi:alpha-beta hydrolase superfamily lysophospholipase
MEVAGRDGRWHDRGVARRTRTVTPIQPTERGTHEGLAFSLWLPADLDASPGGVTILHGAGSCKENHHDFARGCVAAGLAALAFDARGHGASTGKMDAGVLDDVGEMVALLRSRADRMDLPVALRGSSMGGYLAILAAPRVAARAVLAICPASAAGLLRGLASGQLSFDAERAELERFLATHELYPAVEALTVPLLLLHAEGDERVPVEHSRELAERARAPGSRLITVPGGHHRSVQHDPELRAISLRWLARTLRSDARGPGADAQ